MLGTRVFRVFVSSTFRDMAVERNALQERVYPALKAHCAQAGYGFQAIDLRWGISEEASSGQRTMRICLAEIERCIDVSPRPNFVVLLGNRYGWRPLPEIVDANEFKTLRDRLSPEDRDLADKCYDLDDNADPAVYALRSKDRTEVDWNEAQARLRPALAAAAEAAGLDEATRAKYEKSATEQEIIEGAFLQDEAEKHVFCFQRELNGLPDVVPWPLPDDEDLWPPEAHFRDFKKDGSLYKEAEDLLGDRDARPAECLKQRLRDRLGVNVHGYDVELRDLLDYGAQVVAQAGVQNPPPITGPAADYLDRLCEDVRESLQLVIDAEIARLTSFSHLEQERAAHDAFAKEHADAFIGRRTYLDAIAHYLTGESGHPLCIHSEGGLGKSALVAKAVTDARDAHAGGAAIVARFVGVTSASADLRSLLQDLCSDIGDAYGSAEPVPSTLQELQQELSKRLALATSYRPLVVFVDSLDQLVGGGASVSWLPTELGEYVRFVVTTRPGGYLDGLRARLPEESVVELGPMPADEGGDLLRAWLAGAKRKLQDPQRDEVLGKFAANGSPLYLRLTFEEVRLWTSHTEDVEIGDDVPSIIGRLYKRLEVEHGAQLVGHALGFLACTFERLGLSEDEMLEALATDEEVWAEFSAGARHRLTLRQLPIVIWSRLYFDLAPYLSPRASEGASLMAFFHRELAEVATGRYLGGHATHMHKVLADVMHSLARGKDAGEREWKGSNHALAELPYHLTGAERWDDVFATLTDFTYLEEKAKRVAVVSAKDADGNDATVYNGVLALIDDYDRALAAFPAE